MKKLFFIAAVFCFAHIVCCRDAMAVPFGVHPPHAGDETRDKKFYGRTSHDRTFTNYRSGKNKHFRGRSHFGERRHGPHSKDKKFRGRTGHKKTFTNYKPEMHRHFNRHPHFGSPHHGDKEFHGRTGRRKTFTNY